MNNSYSTDLNFYLLCHTQGEKNYYWHPGQKSDNKHFDVARNEITKCAETENIKDARTGEKIYKWTKVQFSEILMQSRKFDTYSGMVGMWLPKTSYG